MIYIQRALIDNNKTFKKRPAPDDAVLATNPAYYVSMQRLDTNVNYMATETVLSSTTLDESHCYVRINANAGEMEITLPGPALGKVIKFFREDESFNRIILKGVINGETNPASDGGGVASSLALQYGQITLIGNGTSWDA